MGRELAGAWKLLSSSWRIQYWGERTAAEGLKGRLRWGYVECMGEDEEDSRVLMGTEMGVLGLAPGSWAGSEGVLGLRSVKRGELAGMCEGSG